MPANISDEFFVRLKEQFSHEQLLELSSQLARAHESHVRRAQRRALQTRWGK